jgi:proteasome accessory factor C
MDKFDRIFHLHAILSARRTAIPLEDLMARLECSRSTLHRTVNALKDYLHAPVVFDANAGGYRYATQDAGNEAYELPGLWFTPGELQALAVMQRLLKDAGGGLLKEHLAPLARRLTEITKHQRLNLGEAQSRLRLPSIAGRPAGKHFDTVASATLQRRKLWIEYHARSTDEQSERTISPQRITHYRETWYLDAWDEERNALRIFSIDRIARATVLDAPAFDVPEGELEEHYASAYGIFGGPHRSACPITTCATPSQPSTRCLANCGKPSPPIRCCCRSRPTIAGSHRCMSRCSRRAARASWYGTRLGRRQSN